MKKTVFLLALLVGIALNAEAQDESESRKERNDRIAYQAGAWVKIESAAEKVGRPSLTEQMYLHQECAVATLKAEQDLPSGLLVTLHTGGKQVFIYRDEHGVTVYKDASVGVPLEELGNLAVDEPAYKACAEAVKIGVGLPTSLRPLFRGFHGII